MRQTGKSVLIFTGTHQRYFLGHNSGCVSIKEKGRCGTRDPSEGVVLATRGTGRDPVWETMKRGQERGRLLASSRPSGDGFPVPMT